MNDRAEGFITAIKTNKEEALQLAEAGLVLLSKVVGRCSTTGTEEDAKFANTISRIWSKAFSLAIELGQMDAVQEIVNEGQGNFGKRLAAWMLGR